MALTGGRVFDVFHGRTVTWKPAGPVVAEFTFIAGASGYRLLGVVGDAGHWSIRNGGDHTSRSTHSTIVGGRTVHPKSGFVYAIDLRVPEPARFERWFLKQLRAGRYPNMKYFNILNRHWNRKRGWADAVFSKDDHLHLSFIPGAERANSTILRDYEKMRRAKRGDADPKVDRHRPGSRSLKVASPRMSGTDVTFVQRFIGEKKVGAIDGFYGPNTADGVRWYQKMRGIEVTGVVNRETFRHMGVE